MRAIRLILGQHLEVTLADRANIVVIMNAFNSLNRQSLLSDKGVEALGPLIGIAGIVDVMGHPERCLWQSHAPRRKGGQAEAESFHCGHAKTFEDRPEGECLCMAI